MPRIGNAQARDNWLKAKLEGRPAGSSLLDIGAGECAYKPYCAHLDYTSQDIAQYDGTGNTKGLQTETWDFDQIDIVCDLYDMPEDRAYDTVLCTEVLEHVTDPVRAVEKLSRLVSAGGQVIITAPFSSLTHFAPYHYATGFSEYFYRHHLERLGFDIDETTPNGGFFDFLDQELGRARRVRRQFTGSSVGPLSYLAFHIARLAARHQAKRDGERMARRSGELLTFGWQIVATKR